MQWLEEKYISFLGNKLLKFKKVKYGLYGFRCPICGDSKKNPNKTRGSFYIPSKATSYVMGCFNCGASMSFSNFLKMQDVYLWNEYTMEKYTAKQNEKNILHAYIAPKEDIQKKRLEINDLIPLSTLDKEHPVIKYVTNRKISEKNFNRLYYVKKFKEFESKWRSEVPYNKNIKEHPRLIIPFFDKRGNITRLSARSFGDEQPKYLYMKIKEDASRVFGLDTVNKDKTVYVLEGPIDSLFIPNSIAVGSADLLVKELSEYSDYVLIPDNQPRNKEVCKSIKRMVDSGSNVCLWNSDWGKDINDMIMNGKSISDIMSLIKESTYSGIEAKLRFSMWSKS